MTINAYASTSSLALVGGSTFVGEGRFLSVIAASVAAEPRPAHQSAPSSIRKADIASWRLARHYERFAAWQREADEAIDDALFSMGVESWENLD